MTLLDEAPEVSRPERPPVDGREARADEAPPAPPSARAIGLSVLAWTLIILVATVAVLYPLGPLFQRRDQTRLLRSFRVDVQKAADATEGLAGILASEKPSAPETGQAAAIIDLPSLGLQQVVVEGVGPAQTRQAPGHLPGTAGVGQPGNSVLVGRRSGWGGAFGGIGNLQEGDQVVATTVQGQSLYRVTSVETRRLSTQDDYGPTADDRLTLVTSASRAPWAAGRAVVVVAVLDGRPFEPTPQGGRIVTVDGRHGDSSGLASLALSGAGYVAFAVAAALAYRRWRPLTAYLLTTPALVVLAILTAESVTLLLPAWT